MWRLGAFRIISDQSGHVLLSHRTDLDLWNLPGGKSSRMRHLGTRRFAKRSRKPHWQSPLKDLSAYTRAGAQRHQPLLGLHRDRRVTQVSDEADEHRYFALEHLRQRLSPNQREYIRDWASGATPAMRCQDGLPVREWLKTLG